MNEVKPITMKIRAAAKALSMSEMEKSGKHGVMKASPIGFCEFCRRKIYDICIMAHHDKCKAYERWHKRNVKVERLKSIQVDKNKGNRG